MSKHTPGPWEMFKPEANQPGIESLSVNQSIVIFGNEDEEAGVCGRSKDEAIANARLMAAAPELLSALRILADTTIKLAPYPPEVAEGVIAIVDMARSVIANAEST